MANQFVGLVWGAVNVYTLNNPDLPGGGDFDAFCSAGAGRYPPSPDLGPILYALLNMKQLFLAS